MSRWDKVTFKEYIQKKTEIFDSLGREEGASTCQGISCGQCPFIEVNCSAVEMEDPDKALELIMGYEEKVDWSQVPIDTKILVRDFENREWKRGYFAGYHEDTGQIYAWESGKTSFTAENRWLWTYAKLYKEES